VKIRLGRRAADHAGDARRQPDDGERPQAGRAGRARHQPGPAPSAAERRAQRARMVAGCMTGTSLDGLDLALVAIHGHGLALRAELQRTVSLPLGHAVAGPLRRLAGGEAMTASAISQVAADFAALHIAGLRELAAERLDLIAVHGQTVYHAPPLSWQLLAPTPIAHALQTTVVYDLRAADLAGGGQGAPISPLADFLLLRDGAEERAVVNLGGFCNITRLPAGHDVTRVGGADVCVCNQLLDTIARRLWDLPYDRGGAHAMAGMVDAAAARSLASLLRLQAVSGRSLGTGDELQGWIVRWQQRCPPADLARTACAGIAQAIAARCQGVRRLVLAGGGTANKALVMELTGRAGVPVVLSDSLGVPTSGREAMAMAVLGALCQDRIPITIPGVTGVADAPVAGSWVYPTGLGADGARPGFKA
jgi:anhydro-N-acetylmuramic acid kinase